MSRRHGASRLVTWLTAASVALRHGAYRLATWLTAASVALVLAGCTSAGRRLPAGVRTMRPRWPIPTGGFTPTPSTPGSSSQRSQWWPAAASSAIVVHRCPDGDTH